VLKVQVGVWAGGLGKNAVARRNAVAGASRGRWELENSGHGPGLGPCMAVRPLKATRHSRRPPRGCRIKYRGRMGHKAESLNCQVGRDMTASTTEAMSNPPHPGIVKFTQGEVGFRQQGCRLQCGMSNPVCPLSVIHARQGRISPSGFVG
jgi:hypothetical protein